MAKLWNVGPGNIGGGEVGVPTIKRRDFDGVVKEFVKVPAIHTGGREEFVEHKQGNAYISLVGNGFYTVPKGAPFDVPPGISVKALQSMCPHLVSQEEYEVQQAIEEPKAEKSEKSEKPKKQPPQ